MLKATAVSRYLGEHFKRSSLTKTLRDRPRHIGEGFTVRQAGDTIVVVEYNHYNYGKDLTDHVRDRNARKMLNAYRDILELRYDVTDNFHDDTGYVPCLYVEERHT